MVHQIFWSSLISQDILETFNLLLTEYLVKLGKYCSTFLHFMYHTSLFSNTFNEVTDGKVNTYTERSLLFLFLFYKWQTDFKICSCKITILFSIWIVSFAHTNCFIFCTIINIGRLSMYAKSKYLWKIIEIYHPPSLTINILLTVSNNQFWNYKS